MMEVVVASHPRPGRLDSAVGCYLIGKLKEKEKKDELDEEKGLDKKKRRRKIHRMA